MKILLDTETWVWWHAQPDSLSDTAREAIQDPTSEVFLSAASVWEFAKMARTGRIRLSIPGDRWIEQALDMPGLRLVDLSPRIAWQSACLPGEFGGDEADRLIVATAREEQAALVTPNPRCLEYPHVHTLW